MTLIPIIDALGPRTVDEVTLVRRDGAFEDDNERTTTVEYCHVGCPGPAHVTGVPDSPSHFCNHHVHRSIAVTLKRWPSAGAAAAVLG